MTESVSEKNATAPPTTTVAAIDAAATATTAFLAILLRLNFHNA